MLWFNGVSILLLTATVAVLQIASSRDIPTEFNEISTSSSPLLKVYEKQRDAVRVKTTIFEQVTKKVLPTFQQHVMGKESETSETVADPMSPIPTSVTKSDEHLTMVLDEIAKHVHQNETFSGKNKKELELLKHHGLKMLDKLLDKNVTYSQPPKIRRKRKLFGAKGKSGGQSSRAGYGGGYSGGYGGGYSPVYAYPVPVFVPYRVGGYQRPRQRTQQTSRVIVKQITVPQSGCGGCNCCGK